MSTAACLGKGGSLRRVADVVEEQACCARREDEGGDMCVAQTIEHVGDGAVTARDHHAVKRGDIARGVFWLHALTDEAHGDFVPCLSEGVGKGIDLVGAGARGGIVDDKATHTFRSRSS